jgi:hypothetical protein
VPEHTLAGEGEVRFRRLAVSGWKAILNTIAVLLLTEGAKYISGNDYLTGGAMAMIGFILFLIANYY